MTQSLLIFALVSAASCQAIITSQRVPASARPPACITRRGWVASSILSGVAVGSALPSGALIPESIQETEDLLRLQQGLKQLDHLLENWNELTLNCKYAEVNRELLTTEKKEMLLDAAAKSALFNKGTATKTMCKRDAESVRFVMGVGSKKNQKSGPPAMFAAQGLYDKTAAVPQPLLNVDPVINRGFRSLSDNADVAAQDSYLEAMEQFSEAKSGLSANSYASGAADYSSLVAASSDEEENSESPSFLESSRKFALAARAALATIVSLLEARAGL